ncbi:MAG: hypothetical protein ACOYOA_02915 [Saprospiraceae bacterium]
MKYFVLLTSFLALSFSATAQNKRIKMDNPASYVQADLMNSIYTISSSYSIQKYSVEGNKMGNYAFHKYGAVTKLDVSNPFQTVAFYRQGNKLVFLDMNLEKLNEIDLNIFPQVKVSHMAASVDKSGVYLINENNNSLCKINANGDLVVLNRELPIDNIDHLMTYEKNILISGNGKLILLDSFGQMLDAYSTQNVKIGETFKGGLAGQLDGKAVLLDFLEGKVNPIEMPAIDYKNTQCFFSKNNIYIVKDNLLLVY